MRIGIGSTKLEPSLCHGRIDGIGVYVQCLLQHYKKQGYNATPISFPPFKYPWHSMQLPHSMKFNLPYSLATMVALTPLGTALNHSLEKKIDLYHATDYLIPRFRHIPVIATLHDAIMLKHPEWCNPRLREIKNFLIKRSLQWTDHIIAISQAMISDLVEYWGVDENKISVIHQGLEDKWLKKISVEEKSAVLNKFNLQEGFLFSVGTLQPRKNFLRIIQAYELLPLELQKQHKLVLVGKDGWQSDEIRHEILRMQAEHKIVWLQYVTDEELQALYQSARLLLFPSLSEGFGLPVLQAFASDLPLLTSNTTSLPEIAGNAAYYVDPLNAEEIKNGIIKLLEDSELNKKLINSGRERVKLFTLEKCATQTMKLYQKII